MITRYRRAAKNLRTQLLKIVTRAGVKAWPKLFQNLRSARQRELTEEYPIQVVTAWIGNSEAVAKKHYLQVTEAHFEKAVHQAVQTAIITLEKLYTRPCRQPPTTLAKGVQRKFPETKKPRNYRGCLSLAILYGSIEWAILDSNQRPLRCQRSALTN